MREAFGVLMFFASGLSIGYAIARYRFKDYSKK